MKSTPSTLNRGLGLAAALLMLPGAAWGLEGGHELELVARALHWDDAGVRHQPGSQTVSYTQSGIGVQANYRSPFWENSIGFDATLLGVAKLADSGTPMTSILEVKNDGQVADSYMTLSQALVKVRLGEMGQVRIGRQTQSSLLLRSTSTRVAPDTYSGVTFALTPLDGVKVYGAYYDRWRARSSPDFERFKTESTAPGVDNAIRYLAILGGQYARGPYEVTLEHLGARDYLSKYGLVASYRVPIGGDALTFSAGVLGSRDAGSLFVCGAEREMDCIGTGRMDHSGTGRYLDVDWRTGDLTVGGAVSRFTGLWIEDNYAANAMKSGTLNQDHGTNSFPTSSIMGPDFANNGETAWALRLAYDWKKQIPNLKTNVKYVRGSGAKSSHMDNAAVGSESYKELTIQYALPALKNLRLAYSYADYASRIDHYDAVNANIRGMGRASWQVHRYYIDYVYKF